MLTVLIAGLIAAAVFFGIRREVRIFKKGELCDCSGDCAHCRIQCRSNPNYFGLNRKEE
ncbi:MAG: FeoB-associated Cys-rich membrane protein [Ruminococcaceae bacterium]|nr:FeoB-associated Cys-rich membrane protein [Oscillospiraceae bacterium]